MTEHIYSPESVAPAPGNFFTWDEYMLAIEQEVDVDGLRESQLIGKAMRLAPNVIVFQALLGDEPVPYSALDPQWRDRYRL